MTVKEIVEKMDDLTECERVEYLAPLLENLTSLSQNQLTNFQDSWDSDRPFKEFVKAQNKEIKMCIELELSDMGRSARILAGLEPLNENDEIGVSNKINDAG